MRNASAGGCHLLSPEAVELAGSAASSVLGPFYIIAGCSFRYYQRFYATPGINRLRRFPSGRMPASRRARRWRVWAGHLCHKCAVHTCLADMKSANPGPIAESRGMGPSAPSLPPLGCPSEALRAIFSGARGHNAEVDSSPSMTLFWGCKRRARAPSPRAKNAPPLTCDGQWSMVTWGRVVVPPPCATAQTPPLGKEKAALDDQCRLHSRV